MKDDLFQKIHENMIIFVYYLYNICIFIREFLEVFYFHSVFIVVMEGF